MRVLATTLADSAKRFVAATIKAFIDGEPLVGLLHAGVGLEHLAKARLAEINPLLLADGKLDPSVLFWLADESKHQGPAPKALRTIGLERALVLVTHRSEVMRFRAELDLLRELRNGVAHMGVPEAIPSDSFLGGYLAAIHALAEGLLDPPESVFGAYAEVAAAHLAQHLQDEEYTYAVLVAEARSRFETKYPELDPIVHGAMQSAMIGLLNESRSELDQQIAPCPACGLPARLEGELVIDFEVDVEGGPDGPTYNAYPVGEYHAYALGCPTCGLSLDSPGLLDTSGVLENWEVPEDDVRAAAELVNEAEAQAYWEDYDRFR